MKVREATADDIPWMIGQLRAFALVFQKQSGLFLNPSDEYISSLLGLLVADGVVLISEHDTGGRCGLIAASTVQLPLDPAVRILSEVFWWVDPAYRLSRAALALLVALKKVALKLGLPLAVSTEASSKLRPGSLEKHGFTVQEHTYYLNGVA